MYNKPTEFRGDDITQTFAYKRVASTNLFVKGYINRKIDFKVPFYGLLAVAGVVLGMVSYQLYSEGEVLRTETRKFKVIRSETSS